MTSPDWRETRLGYEVEIRGGVTPSKDNLSYWDGEIPWVSAKDMKVERIADSEDHVTELALAETGLSLVPPGAVLVVVRGMILARALPVALTEAPLTINQDMKALLPRRGVHAAFLAWWLRGYATWLLDHVTDTAGHGTKTIRLDLLRSVSLRLPDLEAQRSIARFLDEETAKLDALVAEQQRLVELLYEQRRSLIATAVAQGIEATESGVGDCTLRSSARPGWRVQRIKHFATLQRGYDLTEDQRSDGPYPVVTSGGVVGSHAQFMVPGPGVITGRYGSMGKLFYIEEDFWPHNTALFVADFHRNSPRFVWYSLQTVDFAMMAAKSAVPGIDRNDVHELLVHVPPVEEQTRIVEYLDHATGRIDRLVDLANEAIALLAERRAALISAAVTGQIDVRTYHPAEELVPA